MFLRQLQGIVNGDETGAVGVVSFILIWLDLSLLDTFWSIGLWRLNDMRGGKEMKRK